MTLQTKDQLAELAHVRASLQEQYAIALRDEKREAVTKDAQACHRWLDEQGFEMCADGDLVYYRRHNGRDATVDVICQKNGHWVCQRSVYDETGLVQRMGEQWGHSFRQAVLYAYLMIVEGRWLPMQDDLMKMQRPETNAADDYRRGFHDGLGNMAVAVA